MKQVWVHSAIQLGTTLLPSKVSLSFQVKLVRSSNSWEILDDRIRDNCSESVKKKSLQHWRKGKEHTRRTSASNRHRKCSAAVSCLLSKRPRPFTMRAWYNQE